MKKVVFISNRIKNYNKKIIVTGDKSISIRWALIASQAIGKSVAHNLPFSDDVNSVINCLKKLGIKIVRNKKSCIIFGNGINGFKYKKNIVINAGNSGTCGRLILGLLVSAKEKIKITGDESLKKRDFLRVIKPLKQFGANFYPKNKTKLPIIIKGSNYLRPIKFKEEIGSAQVKSTCMLAALNVPGKTRIIAKKSRNHSELLFKNLKIPINIKKKNKYDFIEIEGKKQFDSFNYNIPGCPSSAAFIVILTLLSKNSKITIKNVNVNPTRDGYIKILNKMGANIKVQRKKKYKGEIIGDIIVKSKKNFKAINCPTKLNSNAIDEFLIIFLVAAKAKGISYFKNLSELNQKESKRLDIAAKFLKMIGIKAKATKDNIKIYGNPKFELNGNYIMQNYLKDHRVFAMTCICALVFGGKWKIYNPESIKTSYPNFMQTLKKLGAIIK